MQKKFKDSKILVVGDIMLDQYYYGTTDRISPESPVPITNIKKIKNNVGGAGNVAMNIASLSGKVEICSFIGKDQAAKILKKILYSNNININFIKTTLPTITKIRIISQKQQLLRLDFEKKFHLLNKTKFLHTIKNIAKNYNILILSDYGKGTLSNTKELINIGNANNMKILVDPKGKDFSKYQGVYLITPNKKEFEDVVGKCYSKNEIKEKALKLIYKYNFSNILITNSEQGMILVLKNKNIINIPSYANNIFNVTGAGDTVIAVIAMALSSGYNIITAIKFANAAAGVVIGKKGTSTLNYEELYDAIHNSKDTQYNTNVVSQNNIINMIK